MRNLGASVLLLMCVAAMSTPAQAQFFAECSSGSKSELEQNIRAHEEHMHRLNRKLITGWYWQGPLPKSFQPVGLAEVRSRLAQMAPRKAAILFYAYNKQATRLCVWLVSATGPAISVVSPLGGVEMLRRLRPESMATLGVTTRSDPVRKKAMSKEAFDQQMAALDQELKALKAGPSPPPPLSALGKTLLPGEVVLAIAKEKIDTLIVIPVFDLGLIPFAALPIGGGRMLIDDVSIVVAPGFFVFHEAQRAAKHDFAGALVVGNPYREDPEWHLARLPGAEAEAREIAAGAGVTPLIGPGATKSAILARLRKTPHPPLIYIAAHGVADDANPLDGGFLALSDGRWTGREIVKQVPRDSARPLVVLSACQTALGKDFDVGTIGIARAWHEVGASNVVMSLWLVGDRSTQLLMTRFIKFAQEAPPDKALRKAILERRGEDPRVVAWAGFAVFGAPER